MEVLKIKQEKEVGKFDTNQNELRSPKIKVETSEDGKTFTSSCLDTYVCRVCDLIFTSWLSLIDHSKDCGIKRPSMVKINRQYPIKEEDDKLSPKIVHIESKSPIKNSPSTQPEISEPEINKNTIESKINNIIESKIKENITESQINNNIESQKNKNIFNQFEITKNISENQPTVVILDNNDLIQIIEEERLPEKFLENNIALENEWYSTISPKILTIESYTNNNLQPPPSVDELKTPEKFKCKICDFVTERAFSMKRHMRKHTGEKPYKCTYCNFAAASAGNLQTHLRTHTGEKPFKCTLCEYAARQYANLKRHMCRHTGEKPYKCQYCKYACAHSSDLTRHIRTHTNEKPYVCKLCARSFAVLGNLNNHMTTSHVGEMAYKCTVCSFETDRSSILKYHMRDHNV